MTQEPGPETVGTCQFCGQPIRVSNHSISKLVGECWHAVADDEPICPGRGGSAEEWEHVPVEK